MDASSVLAGVRSNRLLSMNALADLSGVPVSTISRIESGKVEPTWSMMSRIVSAAGFRLDSQLSEAGSDEPFASVLRRLDESGPEERVKLVKRFPAVARLALVAKRTGARRIELAMELGDALAELERQGSHPIVSSLEAFAGEAARAMSFAPIVYVDQPDTVSGFAPVTRTSPLVMFLLPTTNNVEAVTHDVGGVRMVCREWALLDSLATPGRQADITVHLLDSLMTEAV